MEKQETFGEVQTPRVPQSAPVRQPLRKNDKKKLIISLIVMAVGIVTLVVGLVFLVLKLTSKPAVADGEYLVSAKEWVLEDEPSVVWDFTEVGKGTLTTDGHTNDYDFIWALEEGRLLIETDWLYKLENSYDYELDRGAGRLVLTSGEETVTLVGDFAASE